MSSRLAKYLRFLIAGGCALVADLLVFYFLITTTNNLALASVASFSTGFVVSFSANKFWAFSQKEKDPYAHPTTRQLWLYSLLFVWNNLFTYGCIEILSQFGVSVYIGKAVCVILITLWNYYIYDKYIFARKSEHVG